MTDPFLDDSELAIDERTFIAQTKQQGFYVFSGEVALLKEKSHRKPKSKKSVLPAPEPIAGPSNYSHALSHTHVQTQAHSQSHSQGAKDTPVARLSDGEENSGKRRTRGSVDSPNGKKKRRVVDIVRVAQSLSYPTPLTLHSLIASTPSILISKRRSRSSRWPSRKVRHRSTFELIREYNISAPCQKIGNKRASFRYRFGPCLGLLRSRQSD